MILVTGATGRLGSRIVRLLRRARLDVRCLVRPGSEYYWLNDTGADYFFGDLRDGASLTRAARGCRYVLHAAQVQLESTDNHHRVVTLEGTQRLIEAARAAGVERLVMVSCAGADRGLPSAAFDCAHQAEQALQQSGLGHAILRCGPFLEELVWLARGARKGQRAVFFGEPEAPLRPLARADAALFAVAALDHAAALGQVLTLYGPQQLTLRQALTHTFELAGLPPSFQIVGGVQAKALTRAAGLVGRRWRNHLGRQYLLYGGAGLCEDPGPLLQRLGLPLTPLDEAIRADLELFDPADDPEARESKVVHRQFQATIYEPGEVAWADLPEGPSSGG